MKNTLLKFLVCLFKSKKPSSSPRSFLIVSTTGLGDTLWGAPALHALRIAYPTSSISVLTSNVGKEVLKHNPYIDTLITIQDPVFFSLFPLYFKLKKQQYTDILIFHTSQRPLLPFLSLLGAQNIIGFQGENKGLDALLTKALPQEHLHAVQKRLNLLKALDISPSLHPLEMFLTQEEEKSISHFQEPILCIHPGAKDPYKQWRIEHFISLGQKLKWKGTLLITGSHNEKQRVEAIASEIPGAIPLYDLSLRSFAALLKKAKLMIVGDTGPMHLAFAMGTPTIALFTPTDPKLCGPWMHPKAIIFAKEKTCTPCLKKKCRDPFCLLQIGVDPVYDAAKTLLDV